MSEELKPEIETVEDGNENGSQSPVVTQIEDIKPISLGQLYGKSLNSFCNGAWGHSEEQIYKTFAKQFGPDFKWEEVTSNMEDERLQNVAEEVISDRLTSIMLTGTSLVDDNINQAMADIMSFVGLNVDLNTVTLDNCRKMYMRRVDDLTGLSDVYEVLGYSRRLFDLYNSGTVSPEINEDVLKMQDRYREGTINREVLAWYYYNVAMVYEKYSVQKNSAQAIYKEHYRSLNFMKKALDQTDNNISLIMNIKDALSAESQYDMQSILDACHRVIDNNSDDRSLYLAHRLYAETLAENKVVNGFTSRDKSKITEHYREALEYTTSDDDKLDILKAISKQQKVSNKEAYVATLIEIADLLKGRNRVRALKNVASLIENPETKIDMLKKAINELIDLPEVSDFIEYSKAKKTVSKSSDKESVNAPKIRREDIHLYNSLDGKLRLVAENEPETIKKLDELKVIINGSQKEEIHPAKCLTRMSSKGHDVFVN